MNNTQTKGDPMDLQEEKYPLDFEKLSKGSVVSAERIRDIFAPANARAHEFACMNLVQQIERARSDLYPVIRKSEIVILTDAEAHAYSVVRHAKLTADMSRNARRRSRIDATGFSEADKRQAEHWDRHMAAHTIQSARSLREARRESLMLGAPRKPNEGSCSEPNK